MKIVPDHRTRQYELTCLFDPDFSETQLTTVGEEVAKSVAKHHGQVLSQTSWGKKNLAYLIKHRTHRYHQANFSYWELEFVTDQVNAFEKELYLSESIIRHLLVIKEV